MPALALFLQYLPWLIKGAESIPSLIDYAKKMKSNYESRGEWTPEADAAFTAELENWHPEI